LPHFAPPWQVVVAGSGRQPQTPFTPPPPQVAPVPVLHSVGQPTMLLQLFNVGPHLPPMHVVFIGSAVHSLQEPEPALQPNGQTMSEPHWPAAPHV